MFLVADFMGGVHVLAYVFLVAKGANVGLDGGVGLGEGDKLHVAFLVVRELEGEPAGPIVDVSCCVSRLAPGRVEQNGGKQNGDISKMGTDLFVLSGK